MYYTRFLVRTGDLRQIKENKISLLLNILTPDNLQSILREFIDYTTDVDEAIVSASIRAIGRCARLHSDCMQQCLAALMAMIKSGHDIVVSNAVLVLKSLVQTQLQIQTHYMPSVKAATSSEALLAIIAHLARRIDDIKHPQARACVLWLVGQYSEAQTQTNANNGPEGVVEWAPDVLRKTAKTFSQETTEVKLQISTLVAKLLVLSPASQPLRFLSRYVFSLARYDINYDVRDRTRMLVSLLSGVAPAVTDEEPEERGGVVLRREQVKRVLFEGKSTTIEDDVVIDKDHVMLGSLGVITGKNMRGDRHLPYWLEEGTNSALRDTEEDIPVISFTAMSSAQAQRSLGPSHVGSPVVLTPVEGTSPAGPGIRGGGGKGPWTDLDKFYEDEDDEESEDEESADDSKEERNTGDESEDRDEDDEDDDEEGVEEDKDEGEDSQHHS